HISQKRKCSKRRKVLIQRVTNTATSLASEEAHAGASRFAHRIDIAREIAVQRRVRRYKRALKRGYRLGNSVHVDGCSIDSLKLFGVFGYRADTRLDFSQ